MTTVGENGPTGGFRLLVAASENIPTATEISRRMARVHPDAAWSDAAIEQLLRAGAAAQRWLADHPDEGQRMVTDPAAAVAAMRRSGYLDGPVSDLLSAQASSAAAARPGVRLAGVSVGPAPALRRTAKKSVGRKRKR